MPTARPFAALPAFSDATDANAAMHTEATPAAQHIIPLLVKTRPPRHASRTYAVRSTLLYLHKVTQLFVLLLAQESHLAAHDAAHAVERDVEALRQLRVRPLLAVLEAVL